jgi:SAM-dependent methyltransferase
MPGVYDRLLGPTLFQPFAVDLARRAAKFQPGRVLELAAGTGRVTAELVRELPEAEVVATDLNPAMVEHGMLHVRGAHWQQADAQALPFPDRTVDLVVCQFGVMFFPDKPAAFAESRRVLRPGGRLLGNVWAPLETHDFERAVVDALRTLFPADPPRFLESFPHGYADPERLRADIEAGGLVCEQVETLTLHGIADSVADLARGYCTGTPLRGEIEARGDLEATAAALASLLCTALGDGPVDGAMSAHVFVAQRSA